MAQSLMNAKCRVQNAKVKLKAYKIMAQGHTSILQFAFYNLTFTLLSSRFRSQSLMNAKCRVQNAKVKLKVYKIMAQGHTSILQFAFYNLTFTLLSRLPALSTSLFIGSSKRGITR